MNLGIDFGSTYSSFATYNPVTGLIDLCKPTHSESEAVPSMACYDDDGSLITGHEARGHIQDDDETISFEAFKMLLTETDDSILSARGYSKDVSAQFITEKFLNQQIKKILTNCSEDRIDSLYICVPEVWTTQASAKKGTLDGRFVLRDICQKIPEVNNVRVISEPAAASAYFSHYYKSMTGHQIVGYVLIVDYGGGTLDLTLTKVNTSDEDSASVEIEVKNRTGVGENYYGQVGDAGIAYMEEVVRLAVSECPDIEINDPTELNPKDLSFRKAYITLERKIKSQTSSAKEDDENEQSFRLYNAVQNDLDDISRLRENHDQFTVIRYGKNKVSVTFSHLMRAYDHVIRKKLDECLSDMASYMDDVGIDYDSSNNKEFHVVMVGGFGKYILVQNQVKDFFDSSSTGDLRFEYDLGEDREFAVAMGAGLLADKIISIKKTAPYAIGVMSRRRAQDDYQARFAIKYRQEIQDDGDYWICDDNGPKKFINAANTMRSFLIGYDLKGEHKHELIIKPELVCKITASFDKLLDEYEKKFPESSKLGFVHNIGFAMDDQEVVTLLIRGVQTGTIERIPLKRFNEMFEITEV